ncbi:MAG: hypothetical protein BWY52_00220 [Chloroflexi bacterium ADurb.Bin325]|nr:MAG: hypothetical protein BWY52_00220 [Chloroflexi bacterium ADurb.Bin325]
MAGRLPAVERVQALQLGQGRVIEAGGRAHAHARQERRGVQQPRGLDVAGRAAAAMIARAEDVKPRMDAGRLRESDRRIRDVRGCDLAVVAGGILHGEHARAVRPLPPEKGMPPPRAAEVVVFDARLDEKLRDGGRVAEGVRLPADDRVHAEAGLVEAPGMEHLAGRRFAGRHVQVVLDPGVGGDLPATLRDALPDALEQRGVRGLGHRIGGRLALREVVVGVPLHQAIHCVKVAAAYVHGLGHRPEPVHVDVAVGDDEGGVALGLVGKGRKLRARGGRAGAPGGPIVCRQRVERQRGRGLLPCALELPRLGVPGAGRERVGERHLRGQQIQLVDGVRQRGGAQVGVDEEAEAIPRVRADGQMEGSVRPVVLHQQERHRPRVGPGWLAEPLDAVHVDRCADGEEDLHLQLRACQGQPLDLFRQPHGRAEPGLAVQRRPGVAQPDDRPGAVVVAGRGQRRGVCARPGRGVGRHDAEPPHIVDQRPVERLDLRFDRGLQFVHVRHMLLRHNAFSLLARTSMTLIDASNPEYSRKRGHPEQRPSRPGPAVTAAVEGRRDRGSVGDRPLRFLDRYL